MPGVHSDRGRKRRGIPGRRHKQSGGTRAAWTGRASKVRRMALPHHLCDPKFGRIVEVQHINAGGSIGLPWTPSLGVSAKALRQ
jgi:hypothetical protein